jgi:signal transduction histidine kinase
MLGPLEDLLAQDDLQIEKEQLMLIHRNALRLYKLVNSLLDFSRLEDGRAQANYEPVALGTYTQELASIFRSATERYFNSFIAWHAVSLSY